MSSVSRTGKTQCLHFMVCKFARRLYLKIAPLKHHLLYKRCSRFEILSSTQTTGRITELLTLCSLFLQTEIPHILLLSKLTPDFTRQNFTKPFQGPLPGHGLMVRRYCYKTLKKPTTKESSLDLRRALGWKGTDSETCPSARVQHNSADTAPEREIIWAGEHPCQLTAGFRHLAAAGAARLSSRRGPQPSGFPTPSSSGRGSDQQAAAAPPRGPAALRIWEGFRIAVPKHLGKITGMKFF